MQPSLDIHGGSGPTVTRPDRSCTHTFRRPTAGRPGEHLRRTVPPLRTRQSTASRRAPRPRLRLVPLTVGGISPRVEDPPSHPEWALVLVDLLRLAAVVILPEGTVDPWHTLALGPPDNLAELRPVECLQLPRPGHALGVVGVWVTGPEALLGPPHN
jgi:hypothetical protein